MERVLPRPVSWVYKLCGCMHALSCPTVCDPMDRQAPLSMGFSRQEYWSGVPFPTPGDLPDPRIKHTFSASPELTGRFFTTEPPRKPFRRVKGLV